MNIFFFRDPSTPRTYTFPYTTLFRSPQRSLLPKKPEAIHYPCVWFPSRPDRKSTRLNSSHVAISYAVFCLKKKNYNTNSHTARDIQNMLNISDIIVQFAIERRESYSA